MVRSPAIAKGLRLGWSKIVGLSISTALVSTTIFLLWLFPNIRFPVPTGLFVVGTTLESIEDVSLRLWYPAAPEADQKPYRYLSGEAVPEVLKFAYGHLQKPTAAFSDLPLFSSQAEMPVLLYDHGAGSFREDNTFRLIELASHGFVVAAIAHSKNFSDYNIPSEVTKIPAQFRERLNTLLFPDRLRDIRLAVQKLEQLNEKDSRFSDKLNLERFGMVGFSLGGSVALDYSLEEPRCQAVVNLDGGMLGKARQGVEIPFLQISQSALFPLAPVNNPQKIAEKTGEYYRQEVSDLVQNTQPARFAHWLRVTDSGHAAFSDIARWTPARFGPLRSMMGIGDVSAIAQAVDDLTLSFFEDYLMGKSAFEAAIQRHHDLLTVIDSSMKESY
nr:hypothetical protein [cf. Phormidesmis sp. LEGE 11477]